MMSGDCLRWCRPRILNLRQLEICNLFGGDFGLNSGQPEVAIHRQLRLDISYTSTSQSTRRSSQRKNRRRYAGSLLYTPRYRGANGLRPGRSPLRIGTPPLARGRRRLFICISREPDPVNSVSFVHEGISLLGKVRWSSPVGRGCQCLCRSSLLAPAHGFFVHGVDVGVGLVIWMNRPRDASRTLPVRRLTPPVPPLIGARFVGCTPGGSVLPWCGNRR